MNGIARLCLVPPCKLFHILHIINYLNTPIVTFCTIFKANLVTFCKNAHFIPHYFAYLILSFLPILSIVVGVILLRVQRVLTVVRVFLAMPMRVSPF